ncbi:thiolase family protein [Blastococcus sp. CT_GayMR16]|uniref:thiolase family protein n=1 Tax=Blastococcus sp. CT_GayMR16 TaxID=2559607 RepID=UPI00107333C9|nr:thiolase family protein [Blastococcus sp. CT_GayMR16]TFV91328.1 thiolase family protein [Blastococcus sp. CT_GayMR16]
MSSVDDAPVLISARRTPIGTAGRSLAGFTAADLAAPVIAALADELEPAERADLREVVLGNCMGPGGDVARVAALQAALPVGVPGLTVDRQCGSGLAAVVLAVAILRAEPGVVLAGGVESASTAPWRSWPPVDGGEPTRYERAPFAPAGLGDPDMGVAADLLARDFAVPRSAQDEYAARSHARAFATQRAGGFDAEIVPVGDVQTDDRPREGLSVERLARLRPAFLPDGTVTAGNSCGINDGAALVTAVDAGTHRRLGVPGLRVLATATAGVDPNRPGIGVVPATRLALDRAGLTLDDIDVIEFNEAFAGQVLACCAALDLDPERVCPEGGALALGHPWGASGAVLAVRLFSQLVRRDQGQYGLAAIAVGGGQGVAMVVQSCR